MQIFKIKRIGKLKSKDSFNMELTELLTNLLKNKGIDDLKPETVGLLTKNIEDALYNCLLKADQYAVKE